MEKASIIIVSYNNLHETTAPCLKSIWEKTSYPDYEVVVVDNNSSDGTIAFLVELAGREPRLRPVLNCVNRGFAGGNNDGIKAATGDILVLLNSDTQVSEGWLEKLVDALETDPSVGLVGPVSNEVGNEQKIATTGTTPEEILLEGEAWVSLSGKHSFDTKRLGFFCVALRRDTLERVGLLDEDYDLGFYDDDDYCLRVSIAGYRLVCREDVFVYHRGSASFGKVPQRTKLLLKKNKKLLEQKFGLNSYSPAHPRDRHLELVEYYLDRHEPGPGSQHLRLKIQNRLQLLAGLVPRSFWKRILFHFRLKKVVKLLAMLPHTTPCASAFGADSDTLLRRRDQ